MSTLTSFHCFHGQLLCPAESGPPLCLARPCLLYCSLARARSLSLPLSFSLPFSRSLYLSLSLSLPASLSLSLSPSLFFLFVSFSLSCRRRSRTARSVSGFTSTLGWTKSTISVFRSRGWQRRIRLCQTRNASNSRPDLVRSW